MSSPVKAFASSIHRIKTKSNFSAIFALHQSIKLCSCDGMKILFCIKGCICVLCMQVCSVCKCAGASLGCLQKGCSLKYHYACAVDRGTP